MSGVTTLPFKNAIRTVLDEVGYSNALPEWYTPETVDIDAREQHLIGRASSYQAGGNPLPALTVQVPRLTGGTRTWVVPAVNDQIIMQACVAGLAPALAKQVDPDRVYSHARGDDGDPPSFMQSQVAALLAFQRETASRTRDSGYVLELDIENAFASIDRDKLYEFLDRLKPDGTEVELIRRLLDAWSGDAPGIPMVNDSVFLLGGAWLSVVDREIAEITGNFIRFVDDYRVFGRSEAELEATFEKISRAMSLLGLKINPRKVRIASARDLPPALGNARFARMADVSGAPVDAGMERQLDPEQLADLAGRVLERPDLYLNEGLGRYVLGALRRYRLNGAKNRHASNPDTDFSAKLRKALRADADAMRLAGERLAEFATDPQDVWRTTWTIYLIEQQGSASEHSSLLGRIEDDFRMPDVTRLWARRARLGASGEPPELDDALHDMAYVDAGRRCYGAQLCKGEGF
jgi:hypothetical protein